MTRIALICLLSASISACATVETAADVELDNFEVALDEAIQAGDYQLAMELGSEWTGMPISGNGDGGLEAPTGIIAGIILPGSELETISIVHGRMIDLDSGERHQIDGMMAQPMTDQVRGMMVANTDQAGDESLGTLYGDYRTVGGETDQGSMRATWNVEGNPVTSTIDAHWFVETDGGGRIFGVYTERPQTTWDEAVRLRIDVSGLTEVHIYEDKLWVTTMGTDEDQDSATSAQVNGEEWELTYSEQSCPQVEDADCNTEAYIPADGLTADFSAGVELTTYVARGGVALVEEPTADNEYHTVIVLDDENYGGSSVYEIVLTPAS